MTEAVIVLILLASILVVVIIRHTKGKDYVPQKPKVPYEPLTLAEAQGLYADGELTTRAGYLHYNLSEAYEVDDRDLGVFTGYVKPDAQHDGVLIVYDSNGKLRGQVTGQKDYYASLLNHRRASCYGIESKIDNDYQGEVCMQNIN